MNYGTLHRMEHQEPTKKIQEALGVCSSAVTLGQGEDGVPQGQLAETGDICGCHAPGGAPGLEPEMLLNIPQCPEYPLPTESDLRWRILTHLTKHSKNTGLWRLGVGNFPPWEKSFNLALPRHLQVGLEIQQIQELCCFFHSNINLF